MSIPKHVELSEPWRALEHERAEAMDMQLQLELAPDHLLYGAEVKAVAKRIDKDDVLFELNGVGNLLAQVHLTWSKKPVTNPFPATKLFPGWDEWVREKLVPDCKKYAG